MNRKTKDAFCRFLINTLGDWNGRSKTSIERALRKELKPELDPDQWQAVLTAMTKWLPLLIDVLKP